MQVFWVSFFAGILGGTIANIISTRIGCSFWERAVVTIGTPAVLTMIHYLP